MADDASLSAARAASLKASADTRSDSDLPARDRRTRPDALVDADGAALTVGAPVTLRRYRGQRTCMGHGRGRGWMLLCWRDGEGYDAYGTFEIDQVLIV